MSNKTHGNPVRRRQRGMAGGLMEMILTMGLAGVIMAMMADMMAKQLSEIRDQAVAIQFRQVYESTTQYVRNNWQNLQASANNGQVIPINTLINDGFLPPGFSNRNAFNQRYVIVARSVGALNPTVETLVFAHKSGATAVNPTIGVQEISRIAALVGAEGGFIVSAKHPNPCADCIRGTYAAWQLNLADFRALPNISGSIPPAGSGALAGGILISENLAVSGFMYRYAMPGDGNTMHADLIMADTNRIDIDTGSVSLNSGDLLLQNGDMNLQQGNATITGGNLDLGNGDAEITNGSLRVPLIRDVTNIQPDANHQITIGTPLRAPSHAAAANDTLVVDDIWLASQGRWVSQMLGEDATWVQVGAKRVVDGNSIIKPACSSDYSGDPGEPKIILTPERMDIIGRAGFNRPPPTGFALSATDAGNRWIVNLDNYQSGTGHYAMAMIYCRYINQ